MAKRNKISNEELKKVSAGKGCTKHPMSPKDFDYKYEEVHHSFGAKGSITWGNELSETIPDPKEKNETFTWKGKKWKPTLANCGWNKLEVIWKDENGNFLVPTGIEMWEM